jgi:CubicO group peptidase (beta-lactamase class C family)
MKIIFGFLLILFLSPGCTQIRSIVYFYPDIKDHKKFPTRKINASEKPFSFPQNKNNKEYWESLFKTETYHFKKVLRKTKTRAFIVIHKDSIVYEKYRRGYHSGKVQTVFSVSKSLIALLYLRALEDGMISTFNKTITEFLPELSDSSFGKITLYHLMNMRSGLSLKSKKVTNLIEGPANFYYSPDMRETILRLMIVKQAPGEKFVYEDINVQLLAFALEKITKKKLTDYFYEKLWNPIGAEYPAQWICDRTDEKVPYAYSGLVCTALDLAKIGTLFLNEGHINNTSVINGSLLYGMSKVGNDDPQLFQKMLWWHSVIKTDTLLTQNDSVIQQPIYTPAGDIYADGFRGQFIYIFPKKDLVIVRLGKKYEYEFNPLHYSQKRKFNWPKYFLQAAKKIDL